MLSVKEKHIAARINTFKIVKQSDNTNKQNYNKRSYKSNWNHRLMLKT